MLNYRMLLSVEYALFPVDWRSDSIILALSILSVALALVSGAVIARCLHNKAMYQKALLKAQDVENRSQVKELISSRVCDAQRSIAEHLHDNSLGTLAAIHLQLCQFTELARKEELTVQNLSQSAALTKHCYDELRAYVEGLQQNKLNEEAEIFLVQLEELAHLITEPLGIDCQFEIGDMGCINDFEDELQMEIYLILKECITNSVKHASATSVKITLQEKDGNIEFVVTDNGKGFDPEKTQLRGLKYIEERLRKRTGNMSIRNPLQGGTQLHFSIPKKLKTYDKYNFAR